MRFHYIASKPNGKVEEGNIEAANPAAVLEWMGRQGLRPISIKASGGVMSKKGIFKRRLKKITIEDKVFLTKYLALMLRVGTNLFSAIDILIEDFDKPAMKAMLIEMKETLGKGRPFYTTFAKYPDQFSPVFINLVKAGESSGTLDTVFERLSEDLEKQWALRSRLRGSLIYPIILVVLASLVLFLMVTFALPKIADVFMSGSFELPIFTRVVFAVGFFFKRYMLLLLLVFISGALGLRNFVKRTTTGKRLLAQAMNKVPAINGVLSKIALQRFAITMSSLLNAGTPILEALNITADAVGSVGLNDSQIGRASCRERV